VTDLEIPAAGSATVHTLHAGYVGLKVSRDLLRTFATVLIPGDGAPFRPSARA
jgi:hypothetical protein